MVTTASAPSSAWWRRASKASTLVLDLHVLEKLCKARYVFHPEGKPRPAALVRERAERILGGGVSQVVKGLRQLVTKRRLRGDKAKTLLDVSAYYYRNRERMGYDVYLNNGWPIAAARSKAPATT